MITVHPIDTGAASSWSLWGLPFGVRRWRDTGEVVLFVQRSGMRGRPWLRFLSASDDEGMHKGWHVSAYPTRQKAIAG